MVMIDDYFIYIFQVQYQEIITKPPCPQPNGTAALIHHGLKTPAVDPYIILPNQDSLWGGLYLWGFFTLMVIIVFIFFGKFCNRFYKNRRPQR